MIDFLTTMASGLFMLAVICIYVKIVIVIFRVCLGALRGGLDELIGKK